MIFELQGTAVDIHCPLLRVQSTPKPPVGKVGIVGMLKRKRDKGVYFRMTNEEFELFTDEYIKSGFANRSDYIMALVNNTPIIVIKDIIPVLAELRYQGNNLNQIAHKLNGMGSVNSAAMSDLIERWAEAYDKLISIALEVKKDACANWGQQ